MAKPREPRKLTWMDAVVAAVMCALIIGVLAPLLRYARTRGRRVACRRNLAAIGRAMQDYAADCDGAFPRAGGWATDWGATPNWMGTDRHSAFGVSRVQGGGRASVSSCFYLLVRYGYIPTEMFVCPGDAGTRCFRLSDSPNRVPTTFELADAWDFGPPGDAQKHCSYAYHIPFNLYALTTSHDPGFPVAADRNPWIKSPAANPASFANFQPDIPPWAGSAEHARAGNAVTHQGKGQNVYFVDGHVEFAERAYCGLDSDNIYTISTGPIEGHPMGVMPPVHAGLCPSNRKDAVLVHDPPVFGGGPVRHRTKPKPEGAGIAPKPKRVAASIPLPPLRPVDGRVVIDDFERYTNDPNRRLYHTWVDGLGSSLPPPGHPGNGSGAVVGHDVWKPESAHFGATLAEREVVHGGAQSLPLYYNNEAVPYYSEIEAGWEGSQDLTAHAADALAVCLHGSNGNSAEPLYFGLQDDANDVAVVIHPDPNVVTAKRWIEWRIPLSLFSEGGVDVTQVRNLYVGVGDQTNREPAGAGTIYIDDIQLIRDDGLQGDSR